MSIRFGSPNNPFVSANPLANPLVGQALPTAITATAPAAQGSYVTRFGGQVSFAGLPSNHTPSYELGTVVSNRGPGGQGRTLGIG